MTRAFRFRFTLRAMMIAVFCICAVAAVAKATPRWPLLVLCVFAAAQRLMHSTSGPARQAKPHALRTICAGALVGCVAGAIGGFMTAVLLLSLVDVDVGLFEPIVTGAAIGLPLGVLFPRPVAAVVEIALMLVA